jgi:hypothetical protein
MGTLPEQYHVRQRPATVTINKLAKKTAKPITLSNPSVTMAYVIAHSDKPWSWCALSYNPNMTMADILLVEHPGKPLELQP